MGSQKIVNIHEAKTHLSRLLDRVAAGEVVIIARAGKPIARLVPIRGAVGARTPGRYEGRLITTDDFDAPLTPEEIAEFEGTES